MGGARASLSKSLLLPLLLCMDIVLLKKNLIKMFHSLQVHDSEIILLILQEIVFFYRFPIYLQAAIKLFMFDIA